MRFAIVLGRGVLGSSISYHLQRLGVEVLNLGREALGSGSTSRAAGLILHAGNKAAMAAATLEDIAELEANGAETELRRVGTVRVAASDAELRALHEELAVLSEARHSGSSWLNPTEAAELVPWLRADAPAVAGCALIERDAYVDGVTLASAYWSAAKAAGAMTLQRC